MKKYQKVIKLKFTPGTCALCNSEDDELKSIEHNHTFYNSIENYRDMLMKCFRIKLINSEDQTIDVEICGNCVNSLRSAASFRQLVEAAEKSVQKKAPYLKYGKSPRKDMSCAKNFPYLKAKRISKVQEDSNTEDKYDILNAREQVTDKEYFTTSAQVSSHQFEVKLEPSEDFLELLSKVPEDSNSVDIYDVFDSGEQVTDGESSTTSAQMRIVTGYAQEIERSKKKETVIIPPLDISCKTCPICNKDFEVRSDLLMHYDNHFPAFVCEICGLSYSKVHSWYGHRRRHLIDKHDCTLCSRSFLTSSSKSAHVRAYHNKVKPMACYYCDARFSSSHNRKRHMFLKHGRECTMFPCGICKKKFFSLFKLNTHIKKTHDRIKSCFCTVCDKGFYAKPELTAHMVLHTDADKHKCDMCGKGFARLKSYTRHIDSHNNIRDFVCQICEKGFVQKSTLKTHMKVHTKISG